MTQLRQLTSSDRRKFENSPQLSKEERNLFFRLDARTKRLVNTLRKNENKIGFVIQLGYFKYSGRFFSADKFKRRDITFVSKLLAINSASINMERYVSSTQFVHRERILKHLSWSAFDEVARQHLSEHAKRHTEKQKRPKQVFVALVDYCWKHQIEVPTYTEIADIVTKSYNKFETELRTRLNAWLTEDDTNFLDELIDAKTKPHCPHPITQLKRIDQSIKPRDIARSLEQLKLTGSYFFQFEPIIEQLDITDQATEYFSSWVARATTRQLTRFADRDKTYLYLLSYFKHQYYLRQDAMVDIFLKSVSASLNGINKKMNNREIQTKNERNQAIKALTKASKSSRQLLNEIKLITESVESTINERYYKIHALIQEYMDSESSTEQGMVLALEKDLEKEADNSHFFENMEQLSRKLQLRVAGILKTLEFNPSTSNKVLMKAVDHFKLTEGDVGQHAPTDFLKKSEIKFTVKEDGINVGLYKYLLFLHVAEAIKSGDLNLKYSYRYRAIDEYLINKQDWDKNKAQLIKTAGLTNFQNIHNLLESLKKELNDKYHEINRAFDKGMNPYLSVDDGGRVHVTTPKTDYAQSEFIAETLSATGFTPVQQLLMDVDGVCNFSEVFEHYSIKHSKQKLSTPALVAGLIGRGCNIGITKLANISTGLSESTLRNTVNWFFELKNIEAANRKIVTAIKDLALANAFVKDPSNIHSGSDGRKVTVAVDSLLASRSFKYFGKEQGTVMYTFLDERQALYYSTVISASEREAPYVIDGLLHNDVSEKQIHSTDEFGFTEALFCATHLIGTSFAPRFKRVGHKTLYGFSSKKTYQKKGYSILPSSNINQKIIIKHWDEILRFIATIKLNHNSASTLFARLSSYAKQNPLYRALKEFGRIIKSKFILTYYDDVELRQQIQMQLGRIELSNKFSNAVFFDRDHEFQVGEGDEQKLSTACMVLIQNAIVLWNYLYMSDLIAGTKDKDIRTELIDSVKRGSIICWRHVNMRGSYNFKNIAANDSRFDMDRIKALVI